MKKLDKDFFTRDACEVAPDLIGKLLVRKKEDGSIIKLRIDETEVYRGEEDTACHARFGKTARTELLYEEGGYTYIYMIYGLHFLLNVVTSVKDVPQAVLIRSTVEYNGPAKLTKALGVNKELNKIEIFNSDKLWIEDDGAKFEYTTAPRVGIDYATDYYKNIHWRFIAKSTDKGNQ